jgi:hypothetical protein
VLWLFKFHHHQVDLPPKEPRSCTPQTGDPCSFGRDLLQRHAFQLYIMQFVRYLRVRLVCRGKPRFDLPTLRTLFASMTCLETFPFRELSTGVSVAAEASPGRGITPFGLVNFSPQRMLLASNPWRWIESNGLKSGPFDWFSSTTVTPQLA